MAEEASEEERKKRLEAAKSAGVGVRAADTSATDEAAASFGASQVDYIYEQPPQQLFQGILPKYIGNQQCQRYDRFANTDHESRTSGKDHKRNYRNRKRSGSAVKSAFSI